MEKEWKTDKGKPNHLTQPFIKQNNKWYLMMQAINDAC